MTPTTRLQRVLGLPELVLFGLAYMVPLTVFTTYGVVTVQTGGHLPGAYVFTLAAMFFTAYSYGRMVQVHPVAGSAYSYTQKSFGGSVGFVTGWSLLLDYVFLPMLNYLVIGIFTHALLSGVPEWLAVLVSIALVTTLNVLGIKLVARMNFVLVAFQAVFIVVFLGLCMRWFAGHDLPSVTAPFFSGDAKLSLVLGGSAVLCLSFLGFDAISTLSEETRDARTMIPRAIMLVTFAGGVLFIVVSYAAALVFPDFTSFTDQDAAANDVMIRLGGHVFETFFTSAYVAGCVASALAAQASVARILYAMGRDGTLPRRLGRLHRRWGTPSNAVLLVGVVSLVALFISLPTAAAMVSFGALAAFSMVNLSVVKHYLIDRGLRSAGDLVRYGVVPLVGFALTVWLWTNLSGTALTVGLCWLAAGLAYLVFLTRGFRRPAPTLDLREDAHPDGTTETSGAVS
ncbi:APC family permease [Flexivirga sp. ID2601S]|uniref:APC family permease n=1 Tax=Flexivirga aerilata TaxID=1656889 RepID=A0A849AB12_9MICO|nr:APC family permease [Flexivirga aerilata]NNG37689.1 APC family permease [Flexivirga aerilata]